MRILIYLKIFLEILTVNGFIITRNTFPKFNTNLYMIWAYPLFDDSPKRGPRRKIHQAFERGPVRANVTLNYEYANRLAQNMLVPLIQFSNFFTNIHFIHTQIVIFLY